MDYSISCPHPCGHYLEIQVTVIAVEGPFMYLQLPTWRPGRYELAHYAKNLRSLRCKGSRGKILNATKIGTDRWKVTTAGATKVIITYEYYANQLDAGSSLVDDQQWYINFINCLIYVEGRLEERSKLILNAPSSYRIACGLPRNKTGAFIAKDYYQLVDSPMLASDELEHWRYQVGDLKFHLWFMGSHKLSKSKTLKAFKAFTTQQIRMMGEFPEKDYHFLYQIPRYRIYHGVEHSNSTVIALGPRSELHKQRYQAFLGVSSHELFHAWNILKIRPKRLLPYTFNKEVFFEEGFVAEGFTTYYGDLFLVRSGVFSQKQYFKELNTLFKRHFENAGRRRASLTESSWDLWLDGYKNSAPGRKVSIYTKGALVALLLDLTLRNQSQHKSSLDQVLQSLWRDFGKPGRGYTTNDIAKLCQQVSGRSFKDFFQDYISGTAPLEGPLRNALETVGCALNEVPSKQLLKHHYGIRVSFADGSWRLIQIAEDSPAMEHLSLGDAISKIQGKRATKHLNKLIGKSSNLKLTVNRQGRKVTVKLAKGKTKYFNQFKITKLPQITEEQRSGYLSWTGQPF